RKEIKNYFRRFYDEGFKEDIGGDGVKRFFKILAWLIGILAVLVLAVVIAFTVSVKPGVYIIQKMFDGPVEIIDENRYDEVSPHVAREKDITYESAYAENT